MGFAIDPNNGDLYIHGGWTGSVNANDFYKINTQTFVVTPLSRGTGIGIRNDHNEGLKWDPTRNRLILFGGDDYMTVYNDIWTYDPLQNLWTQEIPVNPNAITKRTYMACAVDPETGVLYVHGGGNMGNSPTTVYSDLWQYNFTSKTWTRLNTGVTMTQLWAHSMTFDPADKTFTTYLGRLGTAGSTFIILTYYTYFI
jgi:hypothetical protein